MWPRSFFIVAFWPIFVHPLAPTDEIQDADPAQSGYLDNHNMQPTIVGSQNFGILWQNTYGAKEKWYAKPLVYTPPGGTQLIFLASSMNVIRTLDAVNGTMLSSRTVQPPFLQSDIGCTDIPDYIGITGTPIIDASANTAYFFAKGYKNGASSGGVANGIYKLYAVDIVTLQNKPGFPVLIDGNFADNDNTRQVQRPSLTIINGIVLGGFGGHCDLFNYTGMIVGVSTTPGVGVTNLFAMESSPGASPVVTDITAQKGGKAGIWQSGMGFATDGNRFFAVTGNGQGHANGDVPSSGRLPLSTLDEVVASFTVSASGKVSLTDYFEPYEYLSMDAGDRDLGSSGVTLLDPAVFSGTGVSRIAITVGKNGKAYIMNANNLGGFKQGPGGMLSFLGTDNIIQTILAQGSVFGGVGSYPLEGGFIYFTPVGSPTVCYKIGLDSQGAPLFTLVGQTATNSAGRVGIGVPTVTSYKGQAGTGILWISDPNLGLQAFNAVPVNGILKSIPLTATGGLNKFQRPSFGDSRLYVSDTSGHVFCLGSPVSLPLSCSQPVDFGDTAIGSTSTQIVNCTALIPTSINSCTTGDATWQCLNSTLPKGQLSKGQTFRFPVTWNLTQSSINDAQNASFGKVQPGVASTNLNLYTTNAVPKYSNILPISLTGNTVSKLAYLTIKPLEVDLGGIVVGSAGAKTGLSASLVLQNVGAQTLTFFGRRVDNSSSLPKVGDTLTTGQGLSIPVQFLANQTGAYSTFLQWWTTGGNGYVLLTGSASAAPIANISVSTIEGGWDFSEPVNMDFSNVAAGNTVSRNIRICNSGGSALTITKSKPPIDVELLAPNHGTDLHEAQKIVVNTCALGQVSIVAAPLGVNRPDHTVSDVWILNVDDVSFGVHDVAISANIVTRQLGPLLPNGTAEYSYLGCYYDGAGRQLVKQFNNATNENGWCQATCFKAGYIFAGTEYHTQCWCGNTAPSYSKYTNDTVKKCEMSCPGDITQACGGDGTYVSIYYDQTKYVPGPDSIPGQSKPGSSSLSTSTSMAGSTVKSGLATSSLSSSSTASILISISSSSSETPLSPRSTSSATSTPGIPTASITTSAMQGFTSLGCFSDPAGGPFQAHNMPKLFSNNSMSPELCISSALARLSATPATIYAFVGVEYGRECFAHTATPSPQPSSLSGSTACTMTCMGDESRMCGGPNMYNLYAAPTATITGSGAFE
ncbi:WSC domain-containing protein [Lachnellula subtilissima]|uniref:WSC domain-containing protein n=1 Tax=Lachnellula subtilissima TaxID=602034 RepID=A0A8H8REW1_9HELO|nr:WSC domain-containing protein [Lachnellula subtilissima]